MVPPPLPPIHDWQYLRRILDSSNTFSQPERERGTLSMCSCSLGGKQEDAPRTVSDAFVDLPDHPRRSTGSGGVAWVAAFTDPLPSPPPLAPACSLNSSPLVHKPCSLPSLSLPPRRPALPSQSAWGHHDLLSSFRSLSAPSLGRDVSRRAGFQGKFCEDGKFVKFVKFVKSNRGVWDDAPTCIRNYDVDRIQYHGQAC